MSQMKDIVAPFRETDIPYIEPQIWKELEAYFGLGTAADIVGAVVIYRSKPPQFWAAPGVQLQSPVGATYESVPIEKVLRIDDFYATAFVAKGETAIGMWIPQGPGLPPLHIR